MGEVLAQGTLELIVLVTNTLDLQKICSEMKGVLGYANSQDCCMNIQSLNALPYDCLLRVLQICNALTSHVNFMGAATCCPGLQGVLNRVVYWSTRQQQDHGKQAGSSSHP